VSTLTQAVLAAMLEDELWTDRYIDTMRARLGDMHTVVRRTLTEAGIRHIAAEAGFFVLVDLREFSTSRRGPPRTACGDDCSTRAMST
jgi:DNA-binding transcriptional MocR family regulator